MSVFFVMLGTVFGIGFFPFMSGTLGTLVALPLFFLYQKYFLIYTLLFIFLLLISVPVSQYLSSKWGQKDPSDIVLDEVLGFMLAIFFISSAWKDCLILFFLFRFFDITKIWPISVVEKWDGGWGIVCDDLLAGFFSGFFFLLFKKVFDHVF